MKLKQPHQLNTQVNLKALIYGQPGIGKTTFALSAPNAVLLDFDNGVHRVRAEHQVPTLQVESWQDALDVIPELKNFKTIVIDTAGKMLDYMSAYVIQKNPKMGKSNGALSLQGYGERKAEFSRYLKQLSTMGKHIVFVAHEKEEKEGDNKYIRPEVGGSSGTDLYKELDLIGYMEALGKKRTVSFAPTEKYYAKNSCGLNDIIELPELKEGQSNTFFQDGIIAVYEKSLEQRKEKVQAYNELMGVIEGKIEAVTDCDSANEVLQWIEDYKEHVWSSKLQAKTSLLGKVKSLGLSVDPKSKKVVKIKENAAAV